MKTNTFEMKLADEPFALIGSGKKTVEIRLNDEKRKNLRVGDEIVFTRLGGTETLRTEVKGIHKFPSFMALMSSPLFEGTGSENMSAEEAAESMYGYYTVKQEKEYGVLGIEIALIPRDES